MTVLLWALATLALLYTVWRVGQTNWEPLHNAYRVLPDQIQRGLIILATAVVLLTPYSVRSLVEGKEASVLVTGGWLSAAAALALVLYWSRKL